MSTQDDRQAFSEALQSFHDSLPGPQQMMLQDILRAAEQQDDTTGYGVRAVPRGDDVGDDTAGSGI